MLSRKSKDKTIKEGVVGKYVKKETPPEIPSKCIQILFACLNSMFFVKCH